jgi:hypothetical protein
MDCKNTNNKYFFIGNVNVTRDDMCKLSDNGVDHVNGHVQGLSEKDVHHNI